MQVPRDVTEEMLRPHFAMYGDIEHINILRTPRGLSAGRLLPFCIHLPILTYPAMMFSCNAIVGKCNILKRLQPCTCTAMQLYYTQACLAKLVSGTHPLKEIFLLGYTCRGLG